MICECWDVVVVPFPFVDRPGIKSRPALVLSSAVFNSAHANSQLAMITTAAASTWPSDYALVDWEGAGLTHPCHVRWKIFTLDNRLLVRRVGSLSKRDRIECERRLRRQLCGKEMN